MLAKKELTAKNHNVDQTVQPSWTALNPHLEKLNQNGPNVCVGSNLVAVAAFITYSQPVLLPYLHVLTRSQMVKKVQRMLEGFMPHVLLTFW